MACCIMCKTNLQDDDNTEQMYEMGDIGPEILLMIEQHIKHDTNSTDKICDSCFNNLLQQLKPDPVRCKEETLLEKHVCVWCRAPLRGQRSHSVPDGYEKNEIALRIFPRQILEGELICYTCWACIRNIVKKKNATTGQPIASSSCTNICVWCARSLNYTRSHSLPDGPEKFIVEKAISPREIPVRGRVCYACWMKAGRNVKRQLADPKVITPKPNTCICIWCQSSLIQRQKRRLTFGAVKDEIATRIYPREIPDIAYLCIECMKHFQDPDSRIPDISMTLDSYKRTTASGRHCFVPGCTNPERLIVPQYLKRKILRTNKVYVHENARVCAEHQAICDWNILDQFEFSSSFTKVDIENMLNMSTNDDDSSILLDFENIESLNDIVLQYSTGVTKERFTRMLETLPMLNQTTKNPNTALGLYLMKLHTRDTNDKIASLFQIDKSTVGRLIEKARKAIVLTDQEPEQDTTELPQEIT